MTTLTDIKELDMTRDEVTSTSSPTKHQSSADAMTSCHGSMVWVVGERWFPHSGTADTEDGNKHRCRFGLDFRLQSGGKSHLNTRPSSSSIIKMGLA